MEAGPCDYILALMDTSCMTLYRQLIVSFTLSSAVKDERYCGVLYAESHFSHTPLLFRLEFGGVPFGVDS